MLAFFCAGVRVGQVVAAVDGGGGGDGGWCALVHTSKYVRRDGSLYNIRRDLVYLVCSENRWPPRPTLVVILTCFSCVSFLLVALRNLRCCPGLRLGSVALFWSGLFFLFVFLVLFGLTLGKPGARSCFSSCVQKQKSVLSGCGGGDSEPFRSETPVEDLALCSV